MKKVLTRTPIVSLGIFLLFLLLFRFLMNTYQVTVFQEVSGSILYIDLKKCEITMSIDGNYTVEQGEKAQLVYSSQEQVLKGEVVKCTKDEVVLYFNKLKRLTESEINKATIKVENGKISIGRELRLWG